MDKQSLLTTIKQICDEKNIPLQSVIETIEAALAAAYRKDFGNKLQNIKVDFDLETGDSKVYDIKTVVEDLPEDALINLENISEEEDLKQTVESLVNKNLSDNRSQIYKKEQADERDERQDASANLEKGEDDKPKFNPKTDLQLKDAKLIAKKYKVGDEIKTELEIPADYGRMAAQTAKQVIIQKLREAERQVQFEDFKQREGELLIGTTQRREGNRLFVDIENITAIMPIEEQVRGDHFSLGDRIRVLVLSVEQTTKGPSIIVSRAHEDFLRRLFEMEIPEIASGVVQIKSIAREPGSRSKVAVFTQDDNIDPIGSCVGQRGSRIQTIINELNGEKIDIIQWSENPEKFLSQAISPAKARGIDLDEKNKSAVIHVDPDSLSLAIGKQGQNVRLAVKLTGWNINIQATDGTIPVVEEIEGKDEEIEEKIVD